MRLWLAGLLLFCTSLHSAATSFEFTPQCQKAYKLIWSYRLAEADAIINKEKDQNSGNLIPVYLQSLREFMDIFTSEDKEKYQKFIAAKANRIEKLEDGDNTSPWKDHCKAEVYLHSAILKIRFNDHLAGAYDIQRAYHLLKDLLQEHPDFLPAKKNFLILTAAVGTVPDNYQWLLRILGFNGNLSSSLASYAQLIQDLSTSNEYNVFLNESTMYYAYMTYYLGNDQDKAWNLAQTATSDYAVNPISAFIRASMAMRLKENQEVLKVLAPHVKSTPAFPHLDYLMGNAQLYKTSPEAGLYFARYIRTFKGKSYVKDSYLKLGWAFLLKGDTTNYHKCVKLLKHYGSTVLEEDKHAEIEADMPTDTASIVLLRSRLYYDGGYYREAYAALKYYNDFWARDMTVEQQAEFWYRHGRIADAIHENEEALKCYYKVYYEYSGVKSYYPPAACFYAASIMEKQGKKDDAEELYRKTLFYRGYVYKDAFDQKAYAGLKRLANQ